jgi:deoxyribonuclease V
MPLKQHFTIPTPASVSEGEQKQIEMQRDLRGPPGFSMVTGVDIAYGKTDIAYCVAVTLSTSNWKPVEIQKIKVQAPMKYMSGMLGFREAPVMIETLLRLTHVPDVILIDGNGEAHPRRFGSACHIGLCLDHPTIGIGKNFPAGCGNPRSTSFAHAKRGNRMALMVGPHKAGYEMVTQDGTNPIYVSVGNRLSLDEAANLAIKAAPFYRLPEPIRAADQEAAKFRLAEEGQ